MTKLVSKKPELELLTKVWSTTNKNQVKSKSDLKFELLTKNEVRAERNDTSIEFELLTKMKSVIEIRCGDRTTNKNEVRLESDLKFELLTKMKSVDRKETSLQIELLTKTRPDRDPDLQIELLTKMTSDRNLR